MDQLHLQSKTEIIFTSDQGLALFNGQAAYKVKQRFIYEKATNTNLIVFGLTQFGLKYRIYSTRIEFANYYTTDAVKSK